MTDHMLDDTLAAGIQFAPLVDEETGEVIKAERKPWEEPRATQMPFLTKYESPTRKAMRLAAEQAAADADAKREETRLKAEKAIEDAKTSERAEAVKAAVDSVMPLLKDHDAIIAAVIEKLNAAPPVNKGVRKVVHRDEHNRITHVDEIPL
jgi:hypothetical protein